jgi:VIT1/CCC1 family predicted Fe2+/Mn2+ transporter
MPPIKELKELVEVPSIYAEETWHSPAGRLVREIVFGVNDGVISTVGFLVGMAGAFANHRVCLISGLTEVLAGAVSMFFGGYLSTKSQQEFFEHEIAREKREIEEIPAKEREEIRRIYRTKGFQDEKELDLVVSRITADKRIWLKCMMEEELGLILESMDSPLKIGGVIGAAFLVGGAIPLVPLIFLDTLPAIKVSVFSTSAALFILGAVKTTITRRPWFKSGFEVLFIGVSAAAIGYLIGFFLKRF